MANLDCPCGTGSTYPDCCGVIHERGPGLGTAAVALMRARYCAHVRHDERFLLDSWHPTTRPGNISFDPGLHWLGLDIIATERGTGVDGEGVVEFRAHYRLAAEDRVLHERSRFVRVDGQWRYLDGSS